MVKRTWFQNYTMETNNSYLISASFCLYINDIIIIYVFGSYTETRIEYHIYRYTHPSYIFRPYILCLMRKYYTFSRVYIILLLLRKNGGARCISRSLQLAIEAAAAAAALVVGKK